MSGQEMMQIIESELLEILDHYNYMEAGNLINALRSIMLKHKMMIDMNGYGSCKECSKHAYFNVPWPCDTVKSISKEIYA